VARRLDVGLGQFDMRNNVRFAPKATVCRQTAIRREGPIADIGSLRPRLSLRGWATRRLRAPQQDRNHLFRA
jgi:hypothetical protein